MPTPVSSSRAPKALGPYSAALRAGTLLFVSGQLGLDPASGEMVKGDVAEQTRQALRNVGALLEEAGLSYRHVVRTTVFLADLNDFTTMNEIYRTFCYDEAFTSPAESYPARSTIQAARLPRDAKVEIDAIAMAD